MAKCNDGDSIRVRKKRKRKREEGYAESFDLFVKRVCLVIGNKILNINLPKSSSISNSSNSSSSSSSSSNVSKSSIAVVFLLWQ